MIASVISLEERKTTYRTPEGEERQTFTGNPDWLYAYMPRLKQGCGWELLSLILHHQRMGMRTIPVAISLTQFQRETGRAIRTIQKGLSDLVRVGLLYEELETPGRQDSAIRYAILSQEHVGHGPCQHADGSLVAQLLDGLYEVDPLRLITRNGVVESDTLPEHGKNGAEVVEPATPGCKHLTPRGVRNCMNWVRVSHTPLTAQARQGAAPALPIDKREKKEKRESAPSDGGASPVICLEMASGTPERAEPPSLAPLLSAAPALEHALQERAAEQPDAPSPSEHGGSGEARSSAVGAAPAPSAPMSKPSFFPAQTHAPAPALRSATRAGSRAKRGRDPAARHAAERTAKAQTALEARRAALFAVWLAHPATVQETQMSETERRRFYSGIAKLAHSSLTPEELPALLDAQARWSRGTYTPDPHTLEASLGTLRREAAAWNKQGTTLQKGTTHVGPDTTPRGPTRGLHPAGLAGTGGANHDGDAAILAAVQRVRARAQQESAAGAELGHDPPG